MIRLFFDWWTRQLAGLLPARLRPAAVGGGGSDPADAVLLHLAPAGRGAPVATLEAVRRRRRQPVRLGRFGADAAGLSALRRALGSGRHGPVRLILPPGVMLRQAVSFPLAAERDLGSALRWEIDRITPFPADAVFWTWKVVSRDRSRGQLGLDLFLVARSAVGAVVDGLAAAGLAPERLEAANDPAATVPLDGARPSRGRPLRFAGLAVCAVLAVAAAVVPFWRQQRDLDRLEARAANLRPQVDAAEVLRRRIAARAASNDVVAAEATRVGNALRVLAALTELLPDDTSLYDLSLRDRVLTFSGQSKEAARLIPILAADPAIRNPVFAAPVTRNEITRAQTFSIRAETQP